MHWFINALGIIGNVLFGVGVVPPAYRALRAGNTLFPVDTAWIIGGACLTFYTYLTATYGTSWMTTPIGVIETGAYAILLRYHYFPRPMRVAKKHQGYANAYWPDYDRYHRDWEDDQAQREADSRD